MSSKLGVLGFAAVWAGAVAVLALGYDYGPGEPLVVLGIFGLALPGLAVLATRRYPRATEDPVRDPGSELRVLLLYLLVVVAFLVFGLDAIRGAVAAEPWRTLAKLAAKLAVFVLGPALLARRRGYGWRELFPLRLRRRDGVTILALGGVFVLVNAVIGQGPARIAAAGYPPALLVAGLGFTYLYLLLEVGLVEEFFFRRLLQSRLAAWSRSESTGLLLAALLFGLAHAPGLYLRWEATAAELFPEPSLLFATCYSVAVLATAGLFMGVLWLRTRNLAVLVAVHAAGDLLPNVVETIRAFWG